MGDVRLRLAELHLERDKVVGRAAVEPDVAELDDCGAGTIFATCGENDGRPHAGGDDQIVPECGDGRGRRISKRNSRGGAVAIDVAGKGGEVLREGDKPVCAYREIRGGHPGESNSKRDCEMCHSVIGVGEDEDGMRIGGNAKPPGRAVGRRDVP